MVSVGVAWARSKQEGSMQRLTLITVACAAIIGAVAFVGSSGAQQPGPPTGTLELVSLDRETHFKFVDNPPRSGDPGRPSPATWQSSRAGFATLRIGGPASFTRSS